MEFLKRRKDVDPARIAMLGYGEGGAVASVAASRGGSIAALVLVAAPGVTGGALALEQQMLLLARLNTPEAERNAKLQTPAEAPPGADHGNGPRIDPRRPEAARGHAVVPQLPHVRPREGREERSSSRSSSSTEIWTGRSCPRTPTSWRPSRQRGRDAREQAVKLVKIPGVNHLLVPAKTGEIEEYAKLPGSHRQPERRVRDRCLAEGHAEGQVGCGRFRPRWTTGRRS